MPTDTVLSGMCCLIGVRASCCRYQEEKRAPLVFWFAERTGWPTSTRTTRRSGHHFLGGKPCRRAEGCSSPREPCTNSLACFSTSFSRSWVISTRSEHVPMYHVVSTRYMPVVPYEGAVAAGTIAPFNTTVQAASCTYHISAKITRPVHGEVCVGQSA